MSVGISSPQPALGNESLSKGLGEFVGVGVGVGSDATGVGVGGVFLDTTEVAVGLGGALGDGDVATVVVSLQPTNSAISNPGIAKFSFMFKIYLYVWNQLQLSGRVIRMFYTDKSN
ncbi:MAG: hypothetical protein ACBR15_13360 [Microcoleus sp.]